MQDALLRVLLVVLGLSLYPRDPGVLEQQDLITATQTPEGGLLREDLDQEVKETRQVDVEGPQVDIEGPQVDVEEPQVDVEEPQVDTEEPQVDTEEPQVDTEEPQVDTEEPQVDTEGPQVDTGELQVDVEGPQVDGEEPQVDVEGLQVDVEGPQVDIEEPQVDTGELQVDAEEPHVDTEGPQVDIEGPQVDIEGLQVDTEGPQVDTEGPQVDTGEPQVDTEGPQVEVEGPQVDTGELQVDIEGPQVDAEEPQVDTGELQVDIEGPQVDAEEPQVDTGELQVDIEGLQVDIEGLQVDAEEPQVDTGEPQVDIEGPQVDTEGLQVDTEEPQVDIEGPQVDTEMEEVLRSDQEVRLSHVTTETPAQDHPEKSIADWDQDFLWYLWNIYSIISTIRFLRKYLRGYSQKEHREDGTSGDGSVPVLNNNISAETPLPDGDTLHRFYAKCVHISPNKTWRVREFVEGFTSDLLEAMRSGGDSGVGMAMVEDFQVVGDVSNVIVPLTLPKPFTFECQFSGQWTGDQVPPDGQGYGKIKMVERVESRKGCLCAPSDGGEDILCLLHCGKENVTVKHVDVCDGPLCTKNTPFLSKARVAKWFRDTIRRAWEQISHKYEFELIFRAADAPGALAVRFRSGKRIAFNMNPVVKFNDTDGYFFISPRSATNDSDVFWTLSLALYEDRLLKNLSRNLPGDSCHFQTLEIFDFLHKKQTELTGRSALKGFHFKTTMMHLLLTKEPSQWRPEHVVCRLRDFLCFLEKSLEQKLMNHILLGNDLVQHEIELPAVFSEAETVNLFHPLVVNDRLYTKAMKHFQEILKNTHVLIEEYAAIKG